ncbi:MAG: protein translocase subunit SecA 1 [Candidatus Hepatoplasma vulgare]|nr:MAG: protein translocase subunit SecA 1 [Candidatus Hepatoplasma sp.]
MKTPKEKVIKNKKNKTIKYYSIFKKSEIIAQNVLLKSEIFRSLKEKDFKNKTLEFKKNIAKEKDLLNDDNFIIDVFALVHAAIFNVYKISLFKVQIMGAYILHIGDLAEMKTGEGKTLTAILPAYLNSLLGKGVHIITVNEYLSERDAFNTGKVFKYLGLETGSIKSTQNPLQKKEEYHKDVTYITNSEIGFDYLRDNMVRNIEDKVQRGFYYAIIDEADSILIDEARTPLIISGGFKDDERDYYEADKFVKELDDDDYVIDREIRQAYLTGTGVKKAQYYFDLENLYSYKNSKLVHLISNALQANYIFKYDVDYTVNDEKIILIDSFTGRLLHGRQFSEGLNQAIEAKENVKINPETKVFASITYQNLFRMYKKLSGMSGTASSEEEEFLDIYNMRVLDIPTNKPIIRRDLVDVIFATKEAKYNAVILKIKEIHETGQPILLGTRAVSESEILSEKLKELNIPHEILNAKNHAREAEIITKAGEKNTITIATNMAGRGTDIKLGDDVIKLGGLFVLGTERNESRRIDNQLRGRSGRQGDIGYSQFYISLDDEIMQRAGLKRIQKFLKSLDENPITSRTIQKSITLSQKKIEGLNYDYRKNIIEYDDVLNSQRIITYRQRDSVLKSNDLKDLFLRMIKVFVKMLASDEIMYQNGEFNSEIYFQYFFKILEINFEKKDGILYEEAIQIINKKLDEKFEEKFNLWIEKKFNWEKYLKNVLLISIDLNWQTQIDLLNKLKNGIRYRQYAQKNPVQIYVQEADLLFQKYRREVLEQSIVITLNSVPTATQNSSRKIKKRISKNMENFEIKELTVS